MGILDKMVDYYYNEQDYYWIEKLKGEEREINEDDRKEILAKQV